MTEETLTEEYLSKFPTRLRKALEIPAYRKSFVKNVKEEYAPLKVFRAIHNADHIDENDFISVIEEAKLFEIYRPPRRENIESHSISVFTDPAVLVKATKLPNKHRKLLGIAEGIMDATHGPADFKEGNPHHNWYIFEDSKKILAQSFKVKDVKNYKKEGEKA